VGVLCALSAVAARAQEVDSATVATPGSSVSSPTMINMPTMYGAWLGIARHSPTNIIGNIAGRDVVVSALRVQHPFLRTAHMELDYVPELLPAVWVSAHHADGAQLAPCFNRRFCRRSIENQQGVYGFGLSPAGLQLRFAPGSRVQPFVAFDAGALWFTQRMPTSRAEHFSFMLDAGGGVQVAGPDQFGLLLGYKLLHISNGGLARSNPGLDSHVLYAGLVRSTSRRLTLRHAKTAEDAERAEQSVVGSARAEFSTDAPILWGNGIGWSVRGSFMKFLSEHWQVGVAPEYDGIAQRGYSWSGSRLAGLANLTTGGDRWRGYVGGEIGGANGTHQIGETLLGAQIGALRFLAPTSALRGELRWRRSYRDVDATVDALLTIDSYVLGRASQPAVTPALGTLDVMGTAYATFRFDRVRSADVTVAPFITSWAQLGASLDYLSLEANDAKHAYLTKNLFARAYAPLSLRASPFAQGFVSYESGGTAGPESYGAVGGVRHYINRGTALDVGVQWRRHTVSRAGASSNRPPDETTLQARVVTQLQVGRH
jgi:Lipid A 3-O-deacylase (PagL)